MRTRVRRFLWPGVFLLFCLCVLLRLNGSSTGVWSDILYEPGKPPGLLLSTPKHVRADEWHGWTPAALSQARQTPPFPIQNLSLGGERAPLVMSVPVAHYTMFFRPQYWGFFVLDFERGFSFFWCAKIFALFIASLWFFRELGVRNRGLVWFGAIWIFFSGYIQWWFSSPTMLPEMLATWMICTGCVLRFFKPQTRLQVAATFAAFVFCGVNFILCLYPPYQIPLVWLTIAIAIGVCLETRHAGNRLSLRHGILLTAAAVSLTIALLIPFCIDARSTLELVAHTDYPGARRSTGGDLSIFKLFSGVIGFFQTEKVFPKIYDNVCEASNFYLLWPAAFVGIAIARWRRISPVPPLLAALGVVIAVLSIYCILPLPRWLLGATFLDITTERRALLAIGIANILLCTIFLDRYRQQILPGAYAIALGFIFWLGIVALFWVGSPSLAGSSPNHLQVVLALIANAVIVLFFLQSQRRWFAFLFCSMLIVSNAGINPVMHGLSPLTESEGFREIDKLRVADPKGKWLVYHDFVLAQLVIATGAPILNGNKVVPDFTFLHRLDPEGGGDPIYNRYAYAGCELPTPAQPAGARLLQHDLYVLYLPPQAPVLREIDCRYFLFPEPWVEAESNGLSLIKEIPQSKIYIYRPRLDSEH